LGNFTDAILNFQKVISLQENSSNKLSLANAHFNIGLLYWEHNNPSEALRYYNYALEIYSNIGATEDIANACINIGLVYSRKKDTHQAILYYERAIELFSTVKNKTGLASALQNKAVLLDNAGMYDEAELLLFEALNIYEQNNYKLGSFSCYSNLSKLYSVTGKKNKAIDFALKAVSMESVDKPIKYLADSYLTLAGSYSYMKNYKKATEFYRKYLTIKDSVFSLEINQQISEIQTRYETEKKEIELQNLHQQLEIQELQLKDERRRIVFVSIILIIILISAIIFVILYLQKRKSYLILVEQNVKQAKSDIEREKSLKIADEKAAYETQKYADTNLTTEQKTQLLESLTIALEKEKCFLDERLTINDLAKYINTNRNYLSQIINEHYQTNFNNFINDFRVREARKMLINREYTNYTIEGIAQSVGFNSKATFNIAFKKFTGVTPSFFRENSGNQ
jgi:YesN/AraC family two-component response regulator